MSDSVKAWHEMKDAEKGAVNHANKINKRNFIWVLDHNKGTVHLYNIRQDADSKDCEKLIELMVLAKVYLYLLKIKNTC